VHAAPDGLPLGQPLPGWTPRPRPPRRPLQGEHVLLRPPHAAADAQALWEATHRPLARQDLWTYLFDGPYADAGALQLFLREAERSQDPLFSVIVTRADGRPRGYASYLRIAPEHGTIEIGNILLGAGLARTTAATEAIYLLARRAFDELGYRRLEWKCNALNARSRRAAERLGFRFEGIFERHMVVKGHSRDTAWYAITDERWPAVRAALQAWLAPENFDAGGRQRRSLAALRSAAALTSDPPRR
jgi:RimJ/RimL family protein N-acetyltransferase